MSDGTSGGSSSRRLDRGGIKSSNWRSFLVLHVSVRSSARFKSGGGEERRGIAGGFDD